QNVRPRTSVPWPAVAMAKPHAELRSRTISSPRAALNASFHRSRGVGPARLPAEPRDPEQQRDDDGDARDARDLRKDRERGAGQTREDETDDGQHRRAAPDDAARTRRESEHADAGADGARRSGADAGRRCRAAVEPERDVEADEHAGDDEAH